MLGFLVPKDKRSPAGNVSLHTCVPLPDFQLCNKILKWFQNIPFGKQNKKPISIKDLKGKKFKASTA